MSIRSLSEKSRQRRNGFTLIGLLIVITIISLLAAILFPVFASAREKVRSAAYLSNLRQLTMGVLAYSQDFDERCPIFQTAASVTPGSRNPRWSGQTGTCWTEIVAPYIQKQNGRDFSTASSTFICPSDTQTVTPGATTPVSSYGLSDNWTDWYCPADCINGTGQAHTFTEAVAPSSTVLLAETLTDPTSTNPTYAHALTPIDGGNTGSYAPCDSAGYPAYSVPRMFVVIAWRHYGRKLHYCDTPPSGALVNVTYTDGHAAAQATAQLSDYRQWAIFQGNGDVGRGANIDGTRGCWYP